MNFGTAKWSVGEFPDNLSSNQVHIWQSRLQQSASIVQKCYESLSIDELARAAKYKFPRGQNQFIVARGLLRLFIGRYLDTDPSGIRFSYGQTGKPAVLDKNGRQIQFNLSHSNDLVVYAFAYDRSVGIDVEHVSDDFDFEPIANQNFSNSENEALKEFDGDAKRIAFFHCWTRKEAYLKARGYGLAASLKSFSVSVAPNKSISLTNEIGAATEEWTIRELNPAANYVGAVVGAGANWVANHYQFEHIQQLNAEFKERIYTDRNKFPA